MNNLEKLKQKMMIKPKVEEREKIAVVIKRQSTTKKRKPISTALSTAQPPAPKAAHSAGLMLHLHRCHKHCRICLKP